MSKLTELAKGECCIRCGAPDAYACHYNGFRQHGFGKGRAIKAHDLMTADFCYRCDQDFSEGNTVGFENKIDRSEEWLYWICKTNIRRMDSGKLIAKGKG